MSHKKKLIAGLIFGFIAAVAFDQWTKLLAVRHLMGQPPFVLWDGVFELLYSENRGAAFGLMEGRQGFFLFIALVVLAAVVFLVIRMPAETKYYPIHCIAMFVAAGAVGNMTDRLIRGYVVDFLYFKLIDFPIFNVADCYVTVSMAALLIFILFIYKEEDFDFLQRKKEEER
ncbi:MAG TPA: signal peptidase II [Candidatus Hungatella pullicola]|nr:signal peptidase II [Candidatus Hungatella pullicola]